MAGARAAAAGAVLLGRGCAAAVLPAGEGAVGHYFDGPIEVVAGYPDVGFTWLESPVWSQEGQFLLFSDVKWEDLAGNTTGMLWKYDAERGVVTELLPRAGAVGPGLPPASLGDYAEAGPNGMAWSSSGDPTLLLCQHAMGRIVSFSLDDVSSGGIADAGVTVVADGYDGAPLNSPNDLTLVGDVLLFSDPPYGLQFRSDASLDQAYERMPQPATNIYFLRSPFNGSEAPQVLLSDVWRPNGLALSAAGKLFVAHTDFDEPHYLPASNVSLSLRLTRQKAMTILFRVRHRRGRRDTGGDSFGEEVQHDAQDRPGSERGPAAACRWHDGLRRRCIRRWPRRRLRPGRHVGRGGGVRAHRRPGEQRGRRRRLPVGHGEPAAAAHPAGAGPRRRALGRRPRARRARAGGAARRGGGRAAGGVVGGPLTRGRPGPRRALGLRRAAPRGALPPRAASSRVAGLRPAPPRGEGARRGGASARALEGSSGGPPTERVCPSTSKDDIEKFRVRNV